MFFHWASFFLFTVLTLAHVSSGYAFDLSYEQALAKSRELNLAQDRQWILLGHYQKKLFGNMKSDVTDPLFFVSSQGRVNPQSELEALLATLWWPMPSEKFDEDPRCRFPARLLWLKKKLALGGESEEQDPVLQKCEMYRRYRAVTKAESVSFVFSSYYTNSPGSAFGHTFFRVNKKANDNGTRSELLDHGLGFAANVTVANPVVYAVYGLIGMFNGVFTNLPYYYKVREYNDFESRDLWSYDLNLEPAEVDMLVRHLWEVGNSYFDYYFFTQNCAYHMLTTLEAAAPRYHVMERVPVYVIPSDAIKAINQEPGLVSGVHFRPALRTLFLHRYASLPPAQKIVFQNYMRAEGLDILLAEPEATQVALLDTALDYMDVVHPENMLDPKSPGAIQKGAILRARARVRIPSPEVSVPMLERNRPDLGHDSARLALGFGSNYKNNFSSNIEARFSLHDLLDPHQGYPEYSTLEFGNFKGSYDHKISQLRFDRVDVFKVVAMNPLGLFMKKPSWRVIVGGQRFLLGACAEDCFAAGFQIGLGFTKHLDSDERWLVYAMLDTQVYYDVHFLDQPYHLAAGPTLGMLYRFSEKLKLQLEDTYFFQAVRAQKDGHQFSSEWRYSLHPEWNLGLRYERLFDSERGQLVGYYFF